MQPSMPNGMVWRWSVSGQYSTATGYMAQFLGQTSIVGAKEVWKTKAPGKCRFFAWLLLLDRC
jgi:hypothetical protein